MADLLQPIMGIGLLGGGIYAIVRRRSMAEKMALQIDKNDWWVKWSRVDYSPEYFRFMYLAGGIFCIFGGGLLSISSLFGGKIPHNPIADTVIWFLVVSVFALGLGCTVYMNIEFRVPRK